jgi:hypothetical protein
MPPADITGNASYDERERSFEFDEGRRSQTSYWATRLPGAAEDTERGTRGDGGETGDD